MVYECTLLRFYNKLRCLCSTIVLMVYYYLNGLLLFPTLPFPSDEPVWAIGTGLVCPSGVAQEVRTQQYLL